VKQYTFIILMLFFLTSCGKDFDSSLSTSVEDYNVGAVSIDRRVGNLTNGATLYSAKCASCHNSDGSGLGVNPDIRNASDADILNAVDIGYGTMAPVLDLSIDDIEDIASVFDTFE